MATTTYGPTRPHYREPPAMIPCPYCDNPYIHEYHASILKNVRHRYAHWWRPSPWTCGVDAVGIYFCRDGGPIEEHCHWMEYPAEHAYLAIKSTLKEQPRP